MTAYLTTEETDYSAVALTTSLILRASAIIDAYCKREIAVKSYTERVPLTTEQRGHLSYYPVIEVTALEGRAKYGITGDLTFGVPDFETITDLSILDVDNDIGSLWCGTSLFGAPYTELKVTYTSGWATIPDKVKVACGLIIESLVNGNTNVKSKKDFDFSIEYFGTKIVSGEIADLLSEYQVRSFR